MRVAVFIFLFFASLSIDAEDKSSKRSSATELPKAKTAIYKRIGETELLLYIHAPKGHKATNKTPVVVFFFGGGWNSGSPEQFRAHCEYFASRGMVAIAANYRVASRHGVKAAQCLADAKSAIRWVREKASDLGIDPEKVVAAGGSAGGHLAAATALVPGFDDHADGKNISAVPNALALFNPALVLAPLKGLEKETSHFPVPVERLGADPEKLSPAHYVRPGAPPTIIFHGRRDETVPFAGVKIFANKMKEAKNRCELVAYDGEGHGFFNYRGSAGKHFKDTVIRMDKFLISLGYLTGSPNEEALK